MSESQSFLFLNLLLLGICNSTLWDCFNKLACCDGFLFAGFEIKEEAAIFLSKKCKREGQSWRDILPGASAEAIDMVSSLLTISPTLRPSAATSLLHPFMTGAETLADYSIEYLHTPSPAFFAFDSTTFTLEQLRQQIHEEVALSGYMEDGSVTSTSSSTFPSPSSGSGSGSSVSPSTRNSASGGGGVGVSGKIRRTSIRDDEEEEERRRRGEDGAPSQVPTQLKGHANASSSSYADNTSTSNSSASRRTSHPVPVNKLPSSSTSNTTSRSAAEAALLGEDEETGRGGERKRSGDAPPGLQEKPQSHRFNMFSSSSTTSSSSLPTEAGAGAGKGINRFLPTWKLPTTTTSSESKEVEGRDRDRVKSSEAQFRK